MTASTVQSHLLFKPYNSTMPVSVKDTKETKKEGPPVVKEEQNAIDGDNKGIVDDASDETRGFEQVAASFKLEGEEFTSLQQCCGETR